MRVENRERFSCEVSSPMIDTRRDGHLVVVDAHFNFDGPKVRVITEPSKHVDWSLNIDELSEADKKRSVYIHLETLGHGRQYKAREGDSS